MFIFLYWALLFSAVLSGFSKYGICLTRAQNLSISLILNDNITKGLRFLFEIACNSHTNSFIEFFFKLRLFQPWNRTGFVFYSLFFKILKVVVGLFVVFAVHFTPYLTDLSSMMLIWASGARCKGRAHLHNRMSLVFGQASYHQPILPACVYNAFQENH